MSCEYCGEEHTDAQYRRGRSGRPYQRLAGILRRDGAHVCWLCGQGIDTSLPAKDARSWTLDHVLPLVLYPCLGLEPANHREAHRDCNSSKGKRAAAQNKRARNSRDW